jgi:hypothetical protein
MAKVTAESLLILAEAIEGLVHWLEVDPSTYDADALGRRLEAMGVLTSDKWEPPQWIKDAAERAHEGFDRVGPESTKETNIDLAQVRYLLGIMRSQAKSTQENEAQR